jgi:hypothetical protein
VGLERPRDIYELQSSDLFHRLYERVWTVLADEIRGEQPGDGR